MSAMPVGTCLGLDHWILLSLLLHVALVLPLMMSPLAPKHLPMAEQQALELFDMVGQAPQAAAQAAALPQAKTSSADVDPPESLPAWQAPSPVEVPQRDKAIRHDEAPELRTPTQTQLPQQTAQPPDKAQEEGRAQEAVQQSVEADLLRQYIATLSRLIKAKVFYPPDLRSTGYAGVVVVRFTVREGGDIQPGSLVVVKGSGHAELDDAALRQVDGMAPFPKPDKAHTVAVPVVFRSEG